MKTLKMTTWYVLALLAIASNVNAQTDSSTAAAVTTVVTTPATAAATNTPSPTQTSTAQPQTTSPTQTTNQQPSTTATQSTQQSTSHENLPALSSSSTRLTLSLPSITQDLGNVPTYQVIIPNMVGNPYLQTSNYPDGTVFIIVGSCLAGIALILIGWRVVYSYLLRRQTQQTRKTTTYPEMNEQRPYTGTNGSPKHFTSAPFAPRDISMDYLKPATNPGDRRSVVSSFSNRPSTGRPPTGATRPPSAVGNPIVPGSSSSMFYSPSAHPGGMTAAALGTQASDRNSAYLPAGYYLRDGNQTTSPRQGINTPSSPSLLMGDNSAPMTRLSRSTTGASLSTSPMSRQQGSLNGRPASSVYQSVSTRGEGQGYVQQRRPVTIHDASVADNRKSKPSQVLDELLGGRI